MGEREKAAARQRVEKRLDPAARFNEKQVDGCEGDDQAKKASAAAM